MEISRRIFRNTIFLYTAEITSNLLLFFLMIIIARKLGSEEFGKLAFINSIIAIATVVAELGLTTYFIKEGSQSIESLAKLATDALITRCATALLALSLTFTYAIFFIHDDSIRYLTIIAALPLIINVFPSIVMALFRIREKMYYESLIKVIYSALVAGAGILLIINGRGISAIIWLNAIALFIVSIIYYYLFINYFSFRAFNSINIDRCYAFFRNAIPFAALAVLGTIYFRIDSIMIEYMEGSQAVGLYNAAYKIMEGLLMIPWIFSSTIFPAISKNLYSQKETVLISSRRALKFLFIISFPLTTIIALFSGRFITLLYGDSYSASIPALQILSITFIAVFASVITSTIINASAKPVINTYIALAMVVINISINIIAIPLWSINGAAFATFFTEIFGLIIGTVYINRNIFTLSYHQYVLKPLMASIGMGIIIFLFPNLLAIPLYSIFYLLLLFIFKGFAPDDIHFLKLLLKTDKPANQPI